MFEKQRTKENDQYVVAELTPPSRCVPCIAKGNAARLCLPERASCKKVYRAAPQVSDCGACMVCLPFRDITKGSKLYDQFSLMKEEASNFYKNMNFCVNMW